MTPSARILHPCPRLAFALAMALLAAPALAQDWSADVLDSSAVDRDSPGAVVPAAGLQEAEGQPQNLPLFQMSGTPAPPEGSMAQRYVFVRNGETLADWPPEANGRIGLVKLTDPTLPATLFGQIANNAAAAGAVAVILISNTTSPNAISAPIPSATIQPLQGELLVDLIDPSVDTGDPPNGAISRFPLRLNPFEELMACEEVPTPSTIASGAYHGTRVPAGVTPDFDENPNTLAPFDGPALETAIFSVGREAAEPTLGVNKNGTGFYAAGTFDAIAGGLARTEVMRSRDGGRTWVSVQPELPVGDTTEPPFTLDPMVYVEEDTGRVFNIELYVGCSYLLFTDDEGENWTRNPIACGDPVNDHQTITAGPPPAGLLTVGFPEVVYYCFNRVADTSCGRSLDGGLTFSPSGAPAYTGIESGNEGAGDFFGVEDFCGGLTGHLQTDGKGRVFLPAGRCAAPTIARSEDGGVTWERILVTSDILLPFIEGDDAIEALDNDNEHEVTLTVDAADNLYMTWWDHNDRLPYLAISRDHGSTWSEPLMIGPPGVQEVNFPTLDAGSEGRIVIHFPGTVVDDRTDAQRPWNLYQVVSTNALDEDPLFVFTIANDPAEPIHRGNCGPGRCAGMFDFLDVVVPPAEVPAFADGFWAAGVDTCGLNCKVCGSVAGGMDGIAVRQVAGPSLRAEPLLVEDTDPAIEYRGGWHRRENANASAGTFHRRVGAPGGDGATPTARLVFEGDSITYFYATSDRGGSADVFLDGSLVQTVSFAGTGREPSFGASVTFDDLGEGVHEIVVEQRTGIAYLDAFEIGPASAEASADASAPSTGSVTEVTTELLGGLPGAVAVATVSVDLATEEVSVVVEGGAEPLSVLLLDPDGGLLASGGALLDGFTVSGVDATTSLAGLYTVQVLDEAGGTDSVEISVAQTVRRP